MFAHVPHIFTSGEGGTGPVETKRGDVPIGGGEELRELHPPLMLERVVLVNLGRVGEAVAACIGSQAVLAAGEIEKMFYVRAV